jgi:type I restriction enzyme S subunit
VSILSEYAFKYISLEEVDRGTLKGWTEQVFAIAPSRARRKIRKGDVLVSTVRPNLQSHCLIQTDLDDLICSTGFSVIRCRSRAAEPPYVFAHLFASFIERQIEALVTGSNYPAINSSDVKRLRILLPPTFSEQTAIAAILSDMDAEIAALEEKLAKARQLKQGMMQELLTGRIRLV